MLKLIRNYLALKGPIFYDNKEIIDWQYIKNFVCKIKNRHIYFHNEKLKVFLAAQVLSTSTATALNYLEFEIKDKIFEGSSATATFYKIFNDIFDILNSKNKFCKVPGRKVMTEKDLPELQKKIDECTEYIEKLFVNVAAPVKSKRKVSNENEKLNQQNENNSDKKKKETIIVRKPVLKCTTVRTGFLGFIVCLKNLFSLCKMLFQEKAVLYILSYKMSQDHVEMFFALIRRMNGFTNNPTTVQFQSAYKKLLLNNINVAVPASANCSPQDNTLMVSDVNDINIDQINETFKDSNDIMEHDTSPINKVEIQKKKRIRTARANNISFPINEYLHSNYKMADHDYSKNDAWVGSE